MDARNIPSEVSNAIRQFPYGTFFNVLRRLGASACAAMWVRHPCLTVRAASVPPVRIRPQWHTEQGCSVNRQARMPDPHRAISSIQLDGTFKMRPMCFGPFLHASICSRSGPVLLLLDIGNTHTHAAVVERGRIARPADWPTAAWAQGKMLPLLSRQLRGRAPSAVALCSVVPAATVHAQRALLKAWGSNLFDSPARPRAASASTIRIQPASVPTGSPMPSGPGPCMERPWWWWVLAPPWPSTS